MDFLISKFDEPSKAVERRKFMLNPYFKDDEKKLIFDQFYYNSMGITVVGYEKDQKGYSQLYDVIKKWNEELNLTSTYTVDSFKEIEEILDDL